MNTCILCGEAYEGYGHNPAPLHDYQMRGVVMTATPHKSFPPELHCCSTNLNETMRNLDTTDGPITRHGWWALGGHPFLATDAKGREVKVDEEWCKIIRWNGVLHDAPSEDWREHHHRPFWIYQRRNWLGRNHEAINEILNDDWKGISCFVARFKTKFWALSPRFIGRHG